MASKKMLEYLDHFENYSIDIIKEIREGKISFTKVKKYEWFLIGIETLIRYASDVQLENLIKALHKTVLKRRKKLKNEEE